MDTNNHLLTAWLTLSYARKIGIQTIKKLLSHYKTVIAICQAPQSELRQLGLSHEQAHAIAHPNQREIDHSLYWVSRCVSHHIIHFEDERYPTLLKEISQPPPTLFIIGNPTYLSMPQIALVGSRSPSHSGLENAHAFAYQLAQSGLCITSGLAIGIDGAAHRGALAANGATIAVLGTGLKHLYPKRHQKLSADIAQAGCLVSEFSLDTTAKPENFPRRNRLISGLSLGTLVVEAAPKSGSLITTRYATEQNRDVFAIPGSLNNPTARGCIELIQQGAKCVSTPTDILEDINYLPQHVTASSPELNSTISPSCIGQIQNKNEQQILACFDNDDAIGIDQICERSKLPAQKVLATVLLLEIQGDIIPSRGGYTKKG